MNKNIIVAVIVAVLAVGAYFYLMSGDKGAVTPSETLDDNSDYIGMNVMEAETKAETDGVMFRVVEIDGQMQPTTRDFQEGRINAKVENGMVTEYFVETTDPVVLNDESVEQSEHIIIIGMSTADAKAYALEKNVPFRIGTIDGEGLPVTLDYITGRITAEVENDVVIGFTTE